MGDMNTVKCPLCHVDVPIDKIDLPNRCLHPQCPLKKMIRAPAHCSRPLWADISHIGRDFSPNLFLRPANSKPVVCAHHTSRRARSIFPPAGRGWWGRSGVVVAMRIQSITSRCRRIDSAEARGARLQLRQGSSTASSVSA